jgi:hypothetical protein
LSNQGDGGIEAIVVSGKDPIFLHANPRVSLRIPAYLKSCRQNGIAMLNAVDQEDFETVRALGHQMRGSGGMFGFLAITDIGIALENAGKSADGVASRKWLIRLTSYLDDAGIAPN